MQGLKILSLFDGISIAQQALKGVGILIKNYYASEIDKWAIAITQKNFPDTIQLGDIRNVKKEMVEDIDLIIGGSPCQDLSIAKKNREGLQGSRSGLFYEFVRLVKEVKPKYFILENVNSMSKESKQIITNELFGIEPIMINASLVSAQNRKRLFWVGKLVSDTYKKVEIEQPKDRGILLKDILEENVDGKYFVKGVSVSEQGKVIGNELDKSHSLMARDYKGFGNQAITGIQRVGSLNSGGQGDRIYSTEGKSVNLSANGGGRGAKTGLYVINSNGNMTIRKLTPIECERLQSLPDNYTAKGIINGKEINISNTQRYKTLGNGFNCEVIKHILRQLELYQGS